MAVSSRYRPLFLLGVLMMGFINLAEAAARFAAAAVDIEAAKHAALEEACQLVEERAKGLIGHPNSFMAAAGG